MNFIEYQILPDTIWPQLMDIWNEVYPKILIKNNLEAFRAELTKYQDYWHIVNYDTEGQVVGWYFDFIREDDRWFGIIIRRDSHGRGIGKELIELAKQKRGRLCGWVFPKSEYLKRDGSHYPSPIPFYEKLGFTTLPEVKLETDTFTLIKIQWEKS